MSLIDSRAGKKAARASVNCLRASVLAARPSNIQS